MSSTQSLVRSGVKSVERLAVSRQVKPLDSKDLTEARLRVRAAYKKWQRYAPELRFRYTFAQSLGETRLAIKRQFVKNAGVADPRAVDMLTRRAETELFNTIAGHNQSCHVLNSLFGEYLEPKPKDFLSRFLTGKD